MAAWQLSKALYTAKENGWHRFVSMQNHYNLVYREEEREMIPLCMDQGLGGDSVESAGARIFDGVADARGRIDGAVETRWVRQADVLQGSDFVIADAVAKVAQTTRQFRRRRSRARGCCRLRE